MEVFLYSFYIDCVGHLPPPKFGSLFIGSLMIIMAKKGTPNIFPRIIQGLYVQIGLRCCCCSLHLSLFCLRLSRFCFLLIHHWWWAGGGFLSLPPVGPCLSGQWSLFLAPHTLKAPDDLLEPGVDGCDLGVDPGVATPATALPIAHQAQQLVVHTVPGSAH